MHIIKTWYEGLLYPFKEKDWLNKMWLIPLLGVILTPFFEVLVLRGWRVELVKRIGLRYQDILPKADFQSVLRYAWHGVKLWLITGIYIVIPIIIFRILGISPFRQILHEMSSLFGYLFNNDTGLPYTTLMWNSFWVIVKEFAFRNTWLIFYYPYYRAAMVRYALIGKFRKAHLAFGPNILFVIRNISGFFMLLINQFIDKFILFGFNLLVSIIFTPFIGGALAPFFFFYADYWTSGYEYGHLAQKMAEQEYPDKLSEDSYDSVPNQEVL